MNKYELLYIISCDAPEETREAIIKKFSDMVEKDGGKVEFEGNGDWKEVKCKNVPTAIVPKPIYNFLTKNYMKQGVTIVKIERDKRGYDVKLSSGMELEFDTNYNLVDIGD